MERNFYYIGIAFFGMINGLFNQAATTAAGLSNARPAAMFSPARRYW